ncbi:hypothetical protein [Mycoplasma leonicaptivi]|uniref:hypothetical protein n=1 Tax=Mycoplasma leonicaptivi TaxID=36742 RepID=UPI000A5DFA02|nr:hypothetical protein [Mycoplasma leonicaptivi]
MLKKIEYTKFVFIQMGIIQDINLLNFLEEIREFKSFEKFMKYFFNKIIFFEKISDKDKIMIHNFYYFFFFEMISKFSFYWHIQDNDINLKTNQEKILFASKKRKYYFKFLDQFKLHKNYNVWLIKILRKVR